MGYDRLRQWNAKFSNIMLEAGYCQSQHDHSLFFKHNDTSITLLVVYVDDNVITESSVSTITSLKEFLHSKLQLKDLVISNIFLELKWPVLQRVSTLTNVSMLLSSSKIQG